ncbi:MAG: flagellar basal body-associated FliL family protein [bacterium]|nr:flagellar basal body-associated FliL family protein [bacterium]
MADEEKKEGTEGEEAKATPAPVKSKKKKMIIISSVTAVALIIGGFGAFKFFTSEKALSVDAAKISENSANDQSISEVGIGEEEELAENEEALGAMFPLETFVVNLQGGGFIRAQIQLEFSGKAVPKRFTVKLIPIRDAMIALLSSKRRVDLINKEGKDDLKIDTIGIINEMMGREDIKNVYFTNFVIQ